MEQPIKNVLELVELKPIMDQNKLTPVFMTLPYEMREYIYSYLRQPDFLKLRQVCEDLRFETDNYALYNIVFKFRQKMDDEYPTGGYPIPFPHLNSLKIFNHAEELPWGDCENDTVKVLILNKLKKKTFRTLGQISTVQEVMLGPSTFSHTIPNLNWNLKKLHIKFSSDKNLKNLDSLLIQNLGNIEELIVEARIGRANIITQKPLSLRTLRLLAKHSKTLKNVDLSMKFDSCLFGENDDNTNETVLNDQEISSLQEIQLDSLALNLVDVICPSCFHWLNLIQQQKNLKSLVLRFCHFFPHDSFVLYLDFQFLQELSIYLKDVHGYLPFDCRLLVGAVNLRYLQIRRNSSPIRPTTREILNTAFLPEGLIHVCFSGFLLFSDQIPSLFLHLKNMKRLVCIDCETGVDNTGFNTSHIHLIQEHEHLTDLLIDFHCPGTDHEGAATQIKNSLATINVEYKQIDLYHRDHFMVHLPRKQRYAIWVCNKYENTRAEIIKTMNFLSHVCCDSLDLLNDHDKNIFIRR